MHNVWNFKLYKDCKVKHHLLEIACSRKTPEQVEATRKSKSEKMKAYWMNKRQNKEV